MNPSFTNFKLSFGIKDSENDIEYSQIMLGFLQDLYSTYGIALLRDIDSYSQSLALTLNTETQLIHKNIKTLSIVGYVEDIDYVVDYGKGTITSLSSGSITDGATVAVDYTYYVFINESDNLKLEIYPRQNKIKYTIGINPYILNSVTYLGNTLIEDIDFYHYNGNLELTSEPDNFRKPYILDLNIGYDTLPSDLKMAFYELIKLRFDRRKAKADLIMRVEDNSGTTTSYRDDVIPKHLARIFTYYTGRNLASV